MLLRVKSDEYSKITFPETYIQQQLRFLVKIGLDWPSTRSSVLCSFKRILPISKIHMYISSVLNHCKFSPVADCIPNNYKSSSTTGTIPWRKTCSNPLSYPFKKLLALSGNVKAFSTETSTALFKLFPLRNNSFFSFLSPAHFVALFAVR